MRDGERIAGDEILREGLWLDERDHGLQRRPTSRVMEEVNERVRARLAGEVETPPRPEPTNTLFRDWLSESQGVEVRDAELALNGDVGSAATLAAFRRRHGVPPEVTLTPALIAKVLVEDEKRRAVDPVEEFLR